MKYLLRQFNTLSCQSESNVVNSLPYSQRAHLLPDFTYPISYEN